MAPSKGAAKRIYGSILFTEAEDMVLLGGANAVDKVKDIDSSIKILAKRKKRERTAGELKHYWRGTTADVGYNRRILRHLIPVCP